MREWRAGGLGGWLAGLLGQGQLVGTGCYEL
jgi:hypothetical protein